jgi:hypothetical protein
MRGDPVDLAAQLVQLVDACGQAGVLDGPRRQRAPDPGVIGRPADRQDAAASRPGVPPDLIRLAALRACQPPRGR